MSTLAHLDPAMGNAAFPMPVKEVPQSPQFSWSRCTTPGSTPSTAPGTPVSCTLPAAHMLPLLSTLDDSDEESGSPVSISMAPLQSSLGQRTQKLLDAQDWLDTKLAEEYSMRCPPYLSSTWGVAYRFSKNLEDRDDYLEGPAWGSVVRGVDRGDGWIYVPAANRFLPLLEEKTEEAEVPKSFGLVPLQSTLGIWARRQVEAQEWLDERLALDYTVECPPELSHTSGVAYRYSKNLGDRDGELEGPAWDTTVRAVDRGDGWLYVPAVNRYIPTPVQWLLSGSFDADEDSEEESVGSRSRASSSNSLPLFESNRVKNVMTKRYTGPLGQPIVDDSEETKDSGVVPMNLGMPPLQSELGKRAQAYANAQEWLDHQLSVEFRVECLSEDLLEETSGLAYRVTKDLDDFEDMFAGPEWGTTVKGIDQGDDWVYVPAANRYLPMSLDGMPVMTLSS